MDEKNTDLLEKAKKDFANAKDFFNDTFEQGAEDAKFLRGIEQWNDRERSLRERQNRPVLTFNQMIPFYNQVVNDFRQARPAIRVSPVDDKADIETAEIIQGLIRDTERMSKANQAYDTAFENQCASGIGWIVVGTQYEHDYSFNQEPTVDAVLNFQSCYIDPESKELDGSDARYGFIFEDMDKEAFQEAYPDFDVSSFESDSEWCSKDAVRVADYFYKVEKPITIYHIAVQVPMPNGQVLVQEKIVNADELQEHEDNGLMFEVLNERESKECIVKHCKLTGVDILEENEFPVKYIPIVPVYGSRSFVNNKIRLESLIYQGKDAQRAYNYWKTFALETTALQQKAPYIGAAGSFDTYSQEWNAANNENYSYLEYDIVIAENGQIMPPPQRQPAIQANPAAEQSAAAAKDDIRLGIGMTAANMGQASDQVSGVALRNRQIEGDNSTFHFTANMAASMSHVGRILLELYRVLYSEKKVARILGEDGKSEQQVPLNTPYKKQGKGYRAAQAGEGADGIFDLSVGRYDIVMDIGASYSSKRQETADKLSELMAARPELVNIVGDLAIEALDLPMAQEIADRIRSQMPPELLGDDDPNVARLKAAQVQIKQMEQQMITLQAALDDKQKNQQAELQLEALKIELDKVKTQADAAKTAAETQKTAAETQKIYSEIGTVDVKQMINVLSTQIQDVSEALNIMLDAEEQGMIEASSEPIQSDAQLMESENE